MRILFCSDSFPGRFGVLAKIFASQGNEVLFASHYSRRTFSIEGVRRVVVKAPKGRRGLHNALSVARQAHTAFTLLRRNGFVPDMVLFASSSAISLYAYRVFPESSFFGYIDSFLYPLRTDDFDVDSEQHSLLKIAGLTYCKEIFTFSKDFLAGLPDILLQKTKLVPTNVDTDFFSRISAKPYEIDEKVMEGELITIDMRMLPARASLQVLDPSSLWKLALGIMLNRPTCKVIISCASNFLEDTVTKLAMALPEGLSERLWVQGFRSLEKWRDMLCASSLHIVPAPIGPTNNDSNIYIYIMTEVLEAFSCDTLVAAPVMTAEEEILNSLDSVLVRLFVDSMDENIRNICKILDDVSLCDKMKSLARRGFLDPSLSTKVLAEHANMLCMHMK